MNKIILVICMLQFFLHQIKAQSGNTKGVDIIGKSDVPNGKTVALLVGISKYEHVAALEFADRDAEVFADFLISKKGFGLDSADVKLLENEDATKDNLGNAFSDILYRKGLKKGDKVIFYFSGHGDYEATIMKNQGLLLLYGAVRSNYFQNMFSKGHISTSELNINFIEPLTEMGCQVILIIDACHATKMNQEPLSGGKAGKKATALALEGLPSPIKLYSCKSDQLSLEDEAFGGGRGLFSFVLMEGLYGIADTDGDKVVTYQELQRYLEDMVPKMAAPGKQNPIIRMEDPYAAFVKVSPDFLNDYVAHKIKRDFSYLSKGKGRKALSGLASGEAQRKINRQFFASIKKNDLVSATDLYYNYAKQDSSSNFSFELRRSLSAALQTKAANFINPLINDITKINYHQPDIINARKDLEVAADLLTEKNYTYPGIRAGILVFKALELRVYKGNLDSMLKAVSLLKESLQLEPNASYAYFILGNLYYSMSSFPEAESCFQGYVNLVPKSFQAYNNIGIIYYDQQKFTEARNYFNKAIELDSTADKPFNNLGLVCYQLSRYKEAFQYFNRAIALNPSFADPYHNRGMLYYKVRQYDDARYDFKKAIGLNPRYGTAYQNLIMTCFQLGYYEDEAKSAYESAMELNPDDELSIFYMGKILYTHHEYELAKNYFIRANDLNPKRTETIYSLIETYISMWMPGKAKKVAYIYMQEFPQDSKMYDLMASIFFDNEKNYDSSALYFEKAHAISKAKYPEKYLWSLFYSHRQTEALNLLKKPDQVITKGDRDYFFSSAYAYAQKDREALDYLKKALIRNKFQLVKLQTDTLFDRMRTKQGFRKLIESLCEKRELSRFYPNMFIVKK